MRDGPQRKSGQWHVLDPRRLLGSAFLYRTVQHALAPRSSRIAFIEEYVRPERNYRVLDIGCGPADDLEYMPDTVSYVGFDLSARYVQAARRRWGDRGTFFQAEVSPILLDGYEFDVVVANGVIHHLDDDDIMSLLGLARSVLKPGGRLVTKDPVLLEDQHAVSRFLVKRDRGDHVRYGDEYLDLAHRVFDEVALETRNDMLRCPYDHAIMTAHT
jgi:SAM-dependent methyltransferase